MGTLYLVGDEDLKEAIPYFRKAVKFGPKNIPAWFDLIQSLLQSPTENDEELETIFKTIFSISCNEKHTVMLKFLHGCHLFMREKKDKAIDAWISMYSSRGDSFQDCGQGHFTNLFRVKSRYYWPHTAMRLEDIEKAVYDRLLAPGDKTDRGLNTLKEEIASARKGRLDLLNLNTFNRGAHPSEVNKDSTWRQSNRNTSDSRDSQWRQSTRNTPATGDVSSSSKSHGNNSPGGNNIYYSRGGNSNSVGRYFSMQRRRSPSPDNWRKYAEKYYL